MTSSVTFVARWWNYKTRHRYHAEPVAPQWYASGQPQALSLMARDSTVQEGKDDNVHSMD